MDLPPPIFNVASCLRLAFDKIIETRPKSCDGNGTAGTERTKGAGILPPDRSVARMADGGVMYQVNTLASGTVRILGVVRRNGAFIRRVVGDVMRISGAVGLGQVLAFAAAPLLTRLYTPEAFGHFAVLGALTNILLPLVSLRLNWALPLPQQDAVARDLLALCIVVTAISAPLIAALGTLVQPTLADWIEVSVADVWLLTAALLATGLHEVAMSWLVRLRAFPQVASVRFITLVGVVGFQIAFAAHRPDASSLLLGYIAGYLLGFIRGAYYCRATLLESVRGIDLRRLRRLAVEYRRFPLLATPSSILSGVSSQVPSLVLPSLYGLAVAGQWSLAARVLWQPAAFVGQAVSQVFWGNAARLQWEDPKRLWLLFLFLIAGLLAIMMPALALIWFGGELFSLIFGPAWEQAGHFAGIMVLSSVVSLASFGTESLHIYGLNHWMAGWETARLALIGCALALAWWLDLSATGCVAALTLASFVAYTSLIALNALAICRIRARAGRIGAEPAPTNSAPP